MRRSPLFYKRKLASFNLTVFDTATSRGFCYFWPEIEGNRGANEIATCLYKFITEVPDANVTHISMFCDCCPGQKRNSILPAMIHTLLACSNSCSQTIDLKLLETGYIHVVRYFGTTGEILNWNKTLEKKLS